MGDFGNPAPISIHRFGNNRTIEVKKGDDPHATLSAWTNGPRNPFGSGTPLDPFVWRLGEADSAVGCRGDVTGAANAVARNLFQGAFEFENAQTGILSAGGRVLTVTGRVEGRLDRTVMEALGFGEGWSRSVVGNLSLTVTSPDPIAVRSEYNHEGRVSNFSMTVEVVPEPATLLAVGIGFASCIFRFRRRAS
ncbi:MAG TPA: PEP-CTERM sorting domain-containing protein [Fimbriimonadaceae bacterium]|nr:PEP-CTERM sorting domain-containing protein [Fimbriimonadaceae bacterium]HRJ95843.1 PEP-CTERM sorting domain-containing protein [Fimbriimonadaceae bacterium]